jgi:hypothetical protein
VKSLTVKVDEPLYRTLDRWVRRHGQTKNGLIVALLRAYLERPAGIRGRTFQAGHAFWGMIGSVRDGAGVSDDVDAFLYGRRRRS